MNTIKTSILLITFINLNCQTLRTNKKIYEKIRTHEISETELIDAIKNIVHKEDNFLFWKDIINDVSYPEFHRNQCSVQLFKRHTYAGMPFAEFCKIIHQLANFDQLHLSIVEGLAGKIPIKIAGDRTVFHWQLSTEKNSLCSIYFSLSNSWLLSTLFDKIKGDCLKYENDSLQLIEVGYFGECINNYNLLQK